MSRHFSNSTRRKFDETPGLCSLTPSYRRHRLAFSADHNNIGWVRGGGLVRGRRVTDKGMALVRR